MSKTVSSGLCNNNWVFWSEIFVDYVFVCVLWPAMLTILWSSLKIQKADSSVPISFHSILGKNSWESGHMLHIAMELKERCPVCGATDINYQTHMYVILYLPFPKISAAGWPHACYQSVPCLTLNCFLLPRGHGSLPSDNIHPGHRSSIPAVQVKFFHTDHNQWLPSTLVSDICQELDSTVYFW